MPREKVHSEKWSSPLQETSSNCVCQQSALKRKSKNKRETRSARSARQHDHKHFSRFIHEPLDDSAASVTPEFSEGEPFKFFNNTYQSTPMTFEKRDWMLLPKLPTTEIEGDIIVAEEVIIVIKHTNYSSTHSPFDQIPYRISKSCPSLIRTLVDLCNCVRLHQRSHQFGRLQESRSLARVQLLKTRQHFKLQANFPDILHWDNVYHCSQKQMA